MKIVDGIRERMMYRNLSMLSGFTPTSRAEAEALRLRNEQLRSDVKLNLLRYHDAIVRTSAQNFRCVERTRILLGQAAHSRHQARTPAPIIVANDSSGGGSSKRRKAAEATPEPGAILKRIDKLLKGGKRHRENSEKLKRRAEKLLAARQNGQEAPRP